MKNTEAERQDEEQQIQARRQFDKKYSI